MNHDSRETLRQLMRAKRRAISPKSAILSSQKLTQNLVNLPMICNHEHIAFYMANDHEINPADFMTHCLANGKKCYLPVLDSEKKNHLIFVTYSAGNKFIINRYNIREPEITAHNIHPTHLLDVVLIPLVAFDDNGGRLGMGKGYYDRTFAFINQSSASQPLLIGLAYECQRVDFIELEPWDVPLHGLMTEEGFRDFI